MQFELKRTTSGSSNQPWQLEMFAKSLKKRLKLRSLLQMTGDMTGLDCLLITCGDNNGALNWHFRNAGGNWTWADVQDESLDQIQQLLGENVRHLNPDQFPFDDNSYDLIVCIDVLEHLPEDKIFLMELLRILRSGGKAVVTVPNGDPALLANRIKWRLGMTPGVYGHTRAGYTVRELEDALSQAGYSTHASSGYSRFFTEMVELAINYLYVYVLNKGNDVPTAGQIAPNSSAELKTHGLVYRLYSLLFPILNIISHLDRFLPSSQNNAVIVVASKS